MGRIYTAVIDNVEWLNTDGDIDFFNLVGIAGVQTKLLYIDLIQHTDFGDAKAEIVRWDIVSTTDAGTVGSGGASVTPRAVVDGTASADGTFRVMDTTRTTGTLIDRWRSGFNAQAGLLWTPPEGLEISVFGTNRLAIGSESTVESDIFLSGTIGFEQIG
jgi:hypothetical protein